MSTTTKLIILAATSISLFSCGRSSFKSEKASTASTETANGNFNTTSMDANANADTINHGKIIRNAYLRIQVENLIATRHLIDSLVRVNKAYLANETEERKRNSTENVLIIRVPQMQFENTLLSITHLAKYIENKSINSEDITASYFDLDAHIHSKKILEERLLTLLNKSSKISEILAVEQKLNDVRSEIESMEGSFKVMNNQVNYSTINLQLYELNIAEYSSGIGFFESIKDSFYQGLESFKIITIKTISYWPFFGLSGVLWVLFKRKKIGSLFTKI